MFDYEPKLPEIIFYPILGGLFVHGISLAYPSDTMKLLEVATYINCAIAPAFYLLRDSSKYVDARTPDTKEERPIIADVSAIPKSKDNIYSQGVSKIRFDARRNFARVILGQWEQTQTIDATETSWLKPRVNSVDPRRKLPKLWQGKDTEFRECKKQMEQDGILGRENPSNDKSRFIVRDEAGLREIVAGRR